MTIKKPLVYALPGDLVVKSPPAKAEDSRDAGSIPGSGRPPGVGNDKLLQCSFLENSMDGGAWWATAHGVSKSWIWLSTRLSA